ncbi:MAG: hypothetical protein Q9190_006418 [Brigantiaea leucoxantha]
MDPRNPKTTTAPSLPLQPLTYNNDDKGSMNKRRPVRRNLERRRQQNIQAQKKYREKIKERLEHLETLSVPVAGNEEVITAATPPQNSQSNSTSIEHQNSCQYTGQIPSDNSNELSLDFPDLILSPSLTPASFSDVALCDPIIFSDPSHLFHDEDTASVSQCSATQVDCGCLKAHVQVTLSVPRVYRDTKVLNVAPDLLSPDPYLSTLRIERMCIVQAIFANCLHIGVSEEMFCDDDAVSPFFQPIGKTVNDPGCDRIVKSIQTIFTTLKPDVRPIREQITTKHSPVLDVLPFPTLRKNLIESADTVNEDELYDDLLNGLVCWGGAGVGRRDRDSSTGHTSSGTPWDGRSWEARVWFLRKYWTLLGGEDGELVRQSEWWRNIRGDEISVCLDLVLLTILHRPHNLVFSVLVRKEYNCYNIQIKTKGTERDDPAQKVIVVQVLSTL